jgi:hypothetical protein
MSKSPAPLRAVADPFWIEVLDAGESFALQSDSKFPQGFVLLFEHSRTTEPQDVANFSM